MFISIRCITALPLSSISYGTITITITNTITCYKIQYHTKQSIKNNIIKAMRHNETLKKGMKMKTWRWSRGRYLTRPLQIVLVSSSPISTSSTYKESASGCRHAFNTFPTLISSELATSFTDSADCICGGGAAFAEDASIAVDVDVEVEIGASGAVQRWRKWRLEIGDGSEGVEDRRERNGGLEEERRENGRKRGVWWVRIVLWL